MFIMVTLCEIKLKTSKKRGGCELEHFGKCYSTPPLCYTNIVLIILGSNFGDTCGLAGCSTNLDF